MKKLPEPMIDVLTSLQQSPAIPDENHYTDASAPAARTLKSSAATRSPKLHEQYGIHAPVMTGDHKAVTDQAQGSRLGPKWLHYFGGLHELNFYTPALVHVNSGFEVRACPIYYLLIKC